MVACCVVDEVSLHELVAGGGESSEDNVCTLHYALPSFRLDFSPYFRLERFRQGFLDLVDLNVDLLALSLVFLGHVLIAVTQSVFMALPQPVSMRLKKTSC